MAFLVDRTENTKQIKIKLIINIIHIFYIKYEF